MQWRARILIISDRKGEIDMAITEYGIKHTCMGYIINCACHAIYVELFLFFHYCNIIITFAMLY